MRLARSKLWWAAPWALAASLTCAPGFAFTVLTDTPSGVRAESARAVVASFGPRSTLWLQLVLRTTAERVVLVVPVAPGARLDPGDPDWFSAVEEASAPRVLPPPELDLAACGETLLHDTTSEPRGEAADLESVTLLPDPPALFNYTTDQGLNGLDRLRLEDFDTTQSFVALQYQVTSAPMLIGVRLEDEFSLGEIPGRLEPLARDAALEIVLTTLAPRPGLIEGERFVYAEALGAHWLTEQGTSDYPAAREHFLDEEPNSWVTEVVGQTPLFLPYFPDSRAEVPSVLAAFESRLEGRGYRCPDWSRLVQDMLADDATALEACAPGILSGTTSCPDDEPVSPLACEEVVDLALAFAGARLRDAVLTRHVGRLPARAELALGQAESEAHTVKLYASVAEDAECLPDHDATSGGVGIGQGSADPHDGGAASAGTGGSGGPVRDSGNAPEPVSDDPDFGVIIVIEPDDDDEEVVASESSACSGDSSSSSSDSTCAGDSSSDSETADDTCSGDSSSSSGSDETCSGDGSSSSHSDETCSGDGSSSSQSSEGCSGDGAGDVEGDTCSGDSTTGGGDATCAGGGSGGDCTVARRVPRPKLSVLTLLFAASALPYRRRKRPRRRQRN